MNICLIGYGSIAQVHVQALRGEDVTLHTVVGRLSEPCAEFAREHGFRRYTTDLDEALSASEIDAVIVASPTDLHFEHTRKCLLAGKHVLTEIPLATSLANVDNLISLAGQCGRRLMVCHTQRYYPGLVLAHEQIVQRKLRVHHIVYRYTGLRRENASGSGRRRSWAENLLWHHGGHVVDTALWLLGATEVHAEGQLALPGKPLGITMDLALILRTRQDQLVTVAMSYNTPIPGNECLIIGEEATLLFLNGRLSSGDLTLCEPRPTDASTGPVREQDREFLAAIREDREPTLSGAAIRPTMAVLQSIQDQFDNWIPPGRANAVG